MMPVLQLVSILNIGIVDFDENGVPRVAAFTGSQTDDYKGHLTGDNYSIQGNILLGPEVLEQMEAGFLNTEGSLSDKLMAAMQGANIPGADARCLDRGTSSTSAFLRVYRPDDAIDDPTVFLDILEMPFGEEPIDELQELFDQHFADTDNDGVPNGEDMCPFFDNNLIGQACDDDDATTADDVYTENCICEGTLIDEDGDGITDADDICPDFDDNLIGQECDDEDDTTADDVYTENCICEGIFIDEDGDGITDADDICPDFDDNLIGQTCDDEDATTADDVYTENCICEGIFIDEDGDGITDADDICPDFDDNLIGQACDDEDADTTDDVYTENCICEGDIVDGIDNVLANAIQLFPNPANKVLSVNADFELNGQIQIYNLEGKNIYQKAINGKTLTIDIESIPNGIYTIVYLQEGESMFLQKFVKE